MDKWETEKNDIYTINWNQSMAEEFNISLNLNNWKNTWAQAEITGFRKKKLIYATENNIDGAK